MIKTRYEGPMLAEIVLDIHDHLAKNPVINNGVTTQFSLRGYVSVDYNLRKIEFSGGFHARKSNGEEGGSFYFKEEGQSLLESALGMAVDKAGFNYKVNGNASNLGSLSIMAEDLSPELLQQEEEAAACRVNGIFSAIHYHI